MYIAALRIADDFGCATIGIQYQQGLKDLAPACDLVEGMLNNVDRPPVERAMAWRAFCMRASRCRTSTKSTNAPGSTALVTYRVWKRAGLPPENTLHDLRWGEPYRADEIMSGSSRSPARRRPRTSSAARRARSASASRRCISASAAARSKGISKPGEIVWSRIFVEDGKLKVDLGRGRRRRAAAGGNRAPLAHHHAAMADHARRPHGVTRDQMMARHKANHIQVAYAPDSESANLRWRPRRRCSAKWGWKSSSAGM